MCRVETSANVEIKELVVRFEEPDKVKDEAESRDPNIEENYLEIVIEIVAGFFSQKMKV